MREKEGGREEEERAGSTRKLTPKTSNDAPSARRSEDRGEQFVSSGPCALSATTDRGGPGTGPRRCSARRHTEPVFGAEKGPFLRGSPALTCNAHARTTVTAANVSKLAFTISRKRRIGNSQGRPVAQHQRTAPPNFASVPPLVLPLYGIDAGRFALVRSKGNFVGACALISLHPTRSVCPFAFYGPPYDNKQKRKQAEDGVERIQEEPRFNDPGL
ncbi:hypothetical protein KM043_007758 [Ampulex compressa]|nr:hypothetical protein KM043_007758 [Ampulex compressa]